MLSASAIRAGIGSYAANTPATGANREKKKHGDTLIKRRLVLRALQEIAEGRTQTEYAQRVFPYVLEEALKIQEQHNHDFINKNSNRFRHSGTAYFD